MLLWMFVCDFVWAYVFSSLRLKTELLELFSWLSFFQNCIFNTPHSGIYVDPSFAVSSCRSDYCYPCRYEIVSWVSLQNVVCVTSFWKLVIENISQSLRLS